MKEQLKEYLEQNVFKHGNDCSYKTIMMHLDEFFNTLNHQEEACVLKESQQESNLD